MDTRGLLLHAVAHSADVQDRDGGVLLMGTILGLDVIFQASRRRWIRGPHFSEARRVFGQTNIEIIARSISAHLPTVHPRSTKKRRL